MTTTITDTINVQLDRIEANLPTIPARLFHLQRSLANTAYDRTASVVSAVSESTRSLFDVTRLSGRTVTGQARAAATQVATTAGTGARTVAGQANAQGRKVAGTASGEAQKLIDGAIDQVEGDVETAAVAADKAGTNRAQAGQSEGSGRGRRYEQWTKAELLERAKELDVEGRTGLNKRQLIAALRKA
ncbi:MAG: Rho termination factor N-terminal domain-containing protein [Ilumatobacteraceae bacterium]